MNILNNFFNKIYVISSYPTQNRLNDLIPFLNKENIQFELIISPKKKYFEDINGEGLWVGKGNFSLLSANESILLKESYTKSESFCVLEDDICLDVEYKNKLIFLFNKLPIDWNILNLGFHKNTPINDKLCKSDSFYKLQYLEELVGSHIVAYKRETVSFLLNGIEKNKLPMDWFLSKTIYPNFDTYMCTDKIFYASSYREYESDKNEFYKKYKSEIG